MRGNIIWLKNEVGIRTRIAYVMGDMEPAVVLFLDSLRMISPVALRDCVSLCALGRISVCDATTSVWCKFTMRSCEVLVFMGDVSLRKFGLVCFYDMRLSD